MKYHQFLTILIIRFSDDLFTVGCLISKAINDSYSYPTDKPIIMLITKTLIINKL
ncbi:hypothetical protein Hanom_Chr00s005973g01731641 [Helianthus anomalus]